ncbi:tail protein [Vibrio phage D530]
MEITMNTGLNTKVDAINRVMAAIGSIGINSPEEIDWNIDASDADKLIDAMSQAIQTNQGKGWWFNREEFHRLTPDTTNGYVTVPNNTIACLIKRDNMDNQPITLRGTTLFDAKSLGYDMRNAANKDGTIHAILVMNLPFEYLPATAKLAITDAARFWVVNDKEGDKLKMDALQRAADASYTSLLSEDSGQKRRNMFDNSGIKWAVLRAGGYNNN